MKKLLYADDLALVANGKQELQDTLEEWNGLFTRHGLKINLEKMEVLHIGHQREELDIELEGKKLTQGDSFMYLGGAVCGDGKTEREVRWRVQAGANAWRAVERVMADRQISKRLKGKVKSTCVTPACLYGNPGNDRTTTTKVASVRKQLGTKHSKSNEGRQEKNGGVKGRDGSAEELDRETGEEQTTVGRTRRKDGGWQTTEENDRVTWAGQEEEREAKAEMGGLC